MSQSRWTVMVFRGIGAVLFGTLLGCGAESGGSSGGSSAPPPPPAPVTLMSIVISPSSAKLVEQDLLSVTALGRYSDGAVVPVSADWLSLGTAVATVDRAAGTTILITAQGPGTTDIRATFEGQSALCSISVGVPDDPGPVYSQTQAAVNQIWAYPADGSAPTVLATVGGTSGFCLNRSRDLLYSIHRGPGGGWVLAGVSPGDGTVSFLADLPYDRPIGLASDSLNRVYTSAYGSGEAIRYDPASGLSVVGTGAVGNIGVAVGADDAPYYSPILGADWIRRHDLAGDTITTWGSAPAAAGANSSGFIVPTGLAINRWGEAYIGDFMMTFIWKYVDLNGDGDALDAGERTLWADLPGSGGAGEMMFGIAAARGRTVLINYQGGGSPNDGVWWLADRNFDGDALDADEAVIYNPTFTPNGIDGGCLAAPQ